MKKTLILLLLFTGSLCYGQKPKNNEENEIRALLMAQTIAWNRGDLEGFMQTYWKSDSLMFIGRSGIKQGWQQTLDNYKKGYPDKAAMGKLFFDIVQVKRLSHEYYYVVGKWMLRRTIGDLNGNYDLLIRKIKGHWYIISDHSS